MRKEEIIAKGAYIHPQLEDLVSVKQYIITKINGRKTLLLRLSNDREEVATALTLRVRQYNVKGEFICAEKVEIKKQSISPLSVFALNKPVILNDSCIEFRVDVINVSYGDYTYDVIEGEAHIRYAKVADQDTTKVNTSQLTLDLGGKKQRVAVRTLKAPALLVSMCSILLFVVMCFTIAQIARFMYVETAFTLDNFEYEFMTDNKDDGPIRLTKYNGEALNLVIPAEIEGYPIASIAEGTFSNSRIRSITIQGNTVIEANAFKNCRKLETVSIPHVTEIGDGAFSGCKSLTTVTTGNELKRVGNSSFSGCNMLKSITLPEGLSIVGDYAFKSCTSLETLTIPQSTVSIGEGIIKGCNIKSLTVPYIGNSEGNIQPLCYLYGVDDNLDVPSSLSHLCVTKQNEIPEGSFANCSSLVSVDFKELLKNIGDNAFSGCVNLSEFEIDSTVEYIGAFAFNDCQALDGITLPEGIETIYEATFNNCRSLSAITIPESVTRVNKNAFNNCSSLKSLVVPSNVVAIEEGAFADCVSLIEVSIPYIGYSMDEPMNMSAVFGKKGAKSIQIVRITGAKEICDEAFKDMTSLRTVYLNDDVTSIGKSAFENCISLKKVTMFDGITKIGERAFFGCSSIDNIYVPNGIETIEESQFDGCSSLVYISIPETVVEIKDNAFAGCLSLSEMVLPEEITSIGANAFADCQSLDSISIPAKVTEIKSGTFEGCSSLSIVAIPSTVTVLHERAFAGCSSLTGIALPNALATIKNEAFADCVSLRTFTLPSSVTELGTGILSGCTSLYSLTTHMMTPTISDTRESGCIGYLFDSENSSNLLVPESLNIVTLNNISIISEGAFSDCVGLTGINMPSTITSIEEYAFMGCVSLGRVVLPETITVIKEGTFKGCASLEMISLPRKLTEIQDEAFMGCESLVNIKLHEKVEVIGDYAFASCSSLTEFTVPFTVEYIGFASFYSCNNLKTLSVPYIGSTIDDSEKLIYIFGDQAPASLETINLTGGDSVKGGAFENLSSVKKINIHEDITSIGSNAFAGCASLEELVIPDNVMFIGEDALEGCNSIVNLTVPFVGQTNSDTYSLLYFFANDVPQSLKSVKLTCAEYIPNYCFSGLNSIEEIIIEGNATTVGYQAFYGCLSLKKVVIPDSVVSIGYMAFADCQSLGSITLPYGLSSIGYSAFFNCFRLYEVYNNSMYYSVTPGAGSNGDVGYFALCVFLDGENSEKAYLDGFTFLKDNRADRWYVIEYVAEEGVCTLPTSFSTPYATVDLYYVPQYLFRADESLTEIYMSESIQGIGAYAFLDCTSLEVADISTTQIDEIAVSAFQNCTSLLSIDLPDTVEYICERAFQNCNLIESVDMPSNLLSIGSHAFFGCNALTSVELPLEAYEIGDYAFYNCNSLEVFKTSPALETIGSYAFYNCSSLRSITIGEFVRYIDLDAFFGCTSLREVYNLSDLYIITEDGSYGYVAYYAYIVHNDPNAQPLHNVEIENLDFMKSDDNWFLVGHHSEDGELIFCSFTYQGKLVDSYVIVRDAFVDDDQIVSVEFFGSACKKIGANAFGNQNNIKTVDFKTNSALNIDDIAWVSSHTEITHIVFPTTLSEFPQEIIDSLYNLKYVSFEGNNNITSIPSKAFYMRDLIETVILPDSSVEIGSYAFYSCRALNSITIPEGLNEIGMWSFYRCLSLETIDLPVYLTSIDNYAFQESGLTEIYIPQNVSYVGSGIFYGCSSLTSADLSDAYSLTTIGSAMFSYCYHLKEIELPSQITEIGDNAFDYCQWLQCIVLPESLDSIGYGAFAYCVALENIEFNSNLLYINDRAFYDCSQLDSVLIPSSVVSIGRYAFGECYELDSVTIQGCETIGEYAFAYCTALESIEFPSNLVTIYQYAFYDCNSIEHLDFSNCYDLYKIDEYAFADCAELTCVEFYRCSMISGNAFKNCSALETVIFPYDLMLIGEYAFDGCTSLTMIDLSNATQLSEIYSGAFRGCSAVENLILPSNLRSICSNAFSGCTSLSSLTIPSSVKNIEYSAFYNCQNIREVWNLSTLQLSVGDSSYGYAAYYAIVVHNSRYNSPLEFYETKVDVVTYKFAYDSATYQYYLWGAEDYNSSNMFIFPSVDGYSYTVSRLLLNDVGFGYAYVPLDVARFEAAFLNNCEYSTIYFHGTESEWNSRINYSYWYGTLYTYVDCKHDYSYTWTYDDNNNIVTVPSETSFEIVYDSTCWQYGLGENVCVECGAVVSTETVALKPHTDDGNGRCSECGVDLSYRNVISSFITYNSEYTFSFNEDDELVSNNSYVAGSSAKMTFTADRKMNVTVVYSVSSESSFDYLYIKRNNYEQIDQISGQISGKEFTLSLEAGETIVFEYSKDGSVDSGDDCATIHRITVEYID